MLWLERRIVAALAGPDDERTGGAISEFVDSSFRAMPAHLRLGVVVESIGLGAYVRLRYLGNPTAEQIRSALAGFERNPIGVVRQYPQLLASLVIFSQYEKAAS
ncbi:MAG: hypothetical protein ABJC79_17515 [Acidimicrobiia bacterium]